MSEYTDRKAEMHIMEVAEILSEEPTLVELAKRLAYEQELRRQDQETIRLLEAHLSPPKEGVSVPALSRQSAKLVRRVADILAPLIDRSYDYFSLVYESNNPEGYSDIDDVNSLIEFINMFSTNVTLEPYSRELTDEQVKEERVIRDWEEARDEGRI